MVAICQLIQMVFFGFVEYSIFVSKQNTLASGTRSFHGSYHLWQLPVWPHTINTFRVCDAVYILHTHYLIVLVSSDYVLGYWILSLLHCSQRLRLNLNFIFLFWRALSCPQTPFQALVLGKALTIVWWSHGIDFFIPFLFQNLRNGFFSLPSPSQIFVFFGGKLEEKLEGWNSQTATIDPNYQRVCQESHWMQNKSELA